VTVCKAPPGDPSSSRSVRKTVTTTVVRVSWLWVRSAPETVRLSAAFGAGWRTGGARPPLLAHDRTIVFFLCVSFPSLVWSTPLPSYKRSSLQTSSSILKKRIRYFCFPSARLGIVGMSHNLPLSVVGTLEVYPTTSLTGVLPCIHPTPGSKTVHLAGAPSCSSREPESVLL